MSKEEAMQVLGVAVTAYEDYANNETLQEAYNTIKQALTPPTEQEVCEALSEYYGEKVYYYETNKTFYLSSSKYCNGKSGIISLDKLKDNPHLITLIGRFYEGKAQDE